MSPHFWSIFTGKYGCPKICPQVTVVKKNSIRKRCDRVGCDVTLKGYGYPNDGSIFYRANEAADYITPILEKVTEKLPVGLLFYSKLDKKVILVSGQHLD